MRKPLPENEGALARERARQPFGAPLPPLPPMPVLPTNEETAPREVPARLMRHYWPFLLALLAVALFIGILIVSAVVSHASGTGTSPGQFVQLLTMLVQSRVFQTVLLFFAL
jgi:hypothetical protein